MNYNLKSFGEKKPTRIARIRGCQVEFDVCSTTRPPAGYGDLKYIGRGTIETINGIPQSGKKKYYFWQYKKQEKTP